MRYNGKIRKAIAENPSPKRTDACAVV